jgi:hypothetical protein
MLTFELDQGVGRVRVNPEAVDAVAETEREGRTGTRLIAEITFRNGARYVVCDPERTVAEAIIDATAERLLDREAAQHRIARALETLSLQGV